MRLLGLGIFLILWAVSLGLLLGSLRPGWVVDERFEGHQPPIMLWSNYGGRHLGTLDNAGALRVWSLLEGYRLTEVKLADSVARVPPGRDTHLVAISDDGRLAAVGSTRGGTVVVRCDPSGGPPVVVPVDVKEAVGMAVSSDNETLVTLDRVSGTVNSWSTIDGRLKAEMPLSERSVANPALTLIPSTCGRYVAGFTPTGLYVGHIDIRADELFWMRWAVAEKRIDRRIALPHPIHGRWEVSLGTLKLEAYGSPATIHVPLWDRDWETMPFYGRLLPQLSSPLSRQASGIMPLPTRRLVEMYPDGDLVFLRQFEWHDLFMIPWLYSTLLLPAAALLVWRQSGWANPMSPLPELPEVKRNSEPLPWKLRCAAAFSMIAGLAVFVAYAYELFEGRITLGLWPTLAIEALAILLVVAGGLLLRRVRPARWYLLGIAVPCLMVLCVFLGAAFEGDAFRFEYTESKYRLPPIPTVIACLLLIPVTLQVLWALTHTQTRLIFQAAGYDKVALRRLRNCVQCGYDTRSTIATGGNTCPECGHEIRGYREDCEQVIREFQEENATT